MEKLAMQAKNYFFCNSMFCCWYIEFSSVSWLKLCSTWLALVLKSSNASISWSLSISHLALSCLSLASSVSSLIISLLFSSLTKLSSSTCSWRAITSGSWKVLSVWLTKLSSLVWSREHETIRCLSLWGFYSYVLANLTRNALNSSNFSFENKFLHWRLLIK